MARMIVEPDVHGLARISDHGDIWPAILIEIGGDSVVRLGATRKSYLGRGGESPRSVAKKNID